MSWPWPSVPAPGFDFEALPGSPTIDRPATATGNFSVPAGGVLRFLAGTHNVGGSRTWTLSGTPAAPVFLIADPGAVLDGLASGQITIVGTDWFLVGLDLFRAKIRTGGQRGVIRGCEIHGHTSTSGAMVSGQNGLRQLVLDGNHIHSNGPQTTEEADIHGLKFSAGVDIADVWYIRNHSHHNGGDSAQIGSSTGINTVERVYLIGNDSHDEGENAFDLKLCRDVTIAYNLIRGMTGGLSDPGRGIIVHDDAVNPLVHNNEVEDCDGEGIVSSGSSGLLVLHNKVRRSGAGNSHGAIRVYGSTDAEVAFNSVWDSPVPYEFSINPVVNHHDNLINPPEGGPPSNPVLTLETNMAFAHLEWTQPSGGGVVNSYEVQRSDDGAPPVVLASLGPSVLEYDDSTIVADHQYGFSVRAVNLFGAGISNVAALDTRVPIAPVLSVGAQV